MMNRRDVLAIGGGMLCSGIPLGLVLGDRAVDGGWIDSWGARRDFIRETPRPYFRQQSSEIKGSGQNQQVLLWKYYEAVSQSKFKPHRQEIGDCVGQATGLGVDFLTAIQIGLHRRSEEWRGKCSTEAIYAGSRIEIGKGAACFDSRGRRTDGSTGSWATRWVRDYGVLLRGKYGSADLTEYNPKLARYWGSYRVGVPDHLERAAKEHPVKTVTRVGGWDQACDLVANGYPVLICSSVGFVYETDADGFLRRSREPWYHAMLLIAIDSKSRRQGGCLANSWGERWVTGPKHALGTPAGCFWTDAKNIDSMLKQDDSYGLSKYVGYPRQQLDYRLW